MPTDTSPSLRGPLKESLLKLLFRQHFSVTDLDVSPSAWKVVGKVNRYLNRILRIDSENSRETWTIPLKCLKKVTSVNNLKMVLHQ